MKPIVVQEWEESEAGWGCRPDGFSLHLNNTDCETYIKQYWDEEKKLNKGGKTPHEYSRQCGKPFLHDVEDYVYEALVKAKNSKKVGIRVWCRDLKKLYLEKAFQTPLALANERASHLDDQDNLHEDFHIRLWAYKRAPIEFRNLSDLDNWSLVAYVSAAYTKSPLPFKHKKAIVLDNGGEVRFVK